jgi:hypothetical protein
VKRTRKSFVIWLLILIALPWPIDYWLTRRSARQDARNDELVFRYECNYHSACLADFDGDRDFAHFIITPCEESSWGCLTVREGDREIFQVPYDNTDNTLRTHVAVSEETGSPHLLIYDGVRHKPPLRAAFSYNGERLVEVAPTSLEREILDAMAANDDAAGRWDERLRHDLIRVSRFAAYYGLLIVLALVMVIWGRVAERKGNPTHNARVDV